MYLVEEVQNKWKEVLEHEDLPPIKDAHRKRITACLLENTERELGVYKDHSQFLLSETSTIVSPTNSMGASSSTAGAGAIDTFDPVIMSLLRRSMPNLIAYDVCGVQAMTGPTGLIFAMRTRYANQQGTEAFYWEPNTGFSARGGSNTTSNNAGSYDPGAGYTNNTVMGGGANNVGSNTSSSVPSVSNNAGNSTYNYAGGLQTQVLEGLGSDSAHLFPQMAFSIEKIVVAARGRALKAEYSMELAQDLKAIHGLDAESELANILSTEILAEINREIIRAINVSAKVGSQVNTTNAGYFDLDVDSNGRWMVEKFKGLHFQLEREANQIAKDTRRGKGNIMICSADVASALQMVGVLDYTPAISNNLQVDDTGNTFAGVLNGRIKVYIDPYALGGNYLTMGYKGSNPFDAGLFYCPYVPLQMVRAVDPDTFQPKIGFKTRYGVVANPYAEGGLAAGAPDTTVGYGRLQQDSNLYYRRTIVQNIM